DGRGSGKSPGECEPWSLAESIDLYDAIEWAAAQPWCSGKVGLSGISYFAINQWFVANHQPPSLAAIIPWEGFADLYRDALFHGGRADLDDVLDGLLAEPPDGVGVLGQDGGGLAHAAPPVANGRRVGAAWVCQCGGYAKRAYVRRSDGLQPQPIAFTRLLPVV